MKAERLIDQLVETSKLGYSVKVMEQGVMKKVFIPIANAVYKLTGNKFNPKDFLDFRDAAFGSLGLWGGKANAYTDKDGDLKVVVVEPFYIGIYREEKGKTGLKPHPAQIKIEYQLQPTGRRKGIPWRDGKYPYDGNIDKVLKDFVREIVGGIEVYDHQDWPPRRA